MVDKTSGIIEQSLKIKEVKRKEATHFALCNGGHIRYLISLHKLGKKKLCKNLSSYSSKLVLVVKLLQVTPFKLLKWCNLGYFVSVELNKQIKCHLQNKDQYSWNIIVGTYDEKQKLVIQDFTKETCETIYIKVGNVATKVAMQNEMSFLSQKHVFKSFSIPELIEGMFISENNPFSIQITREFYGEKVELGLNKEIVEIYKELAALEQSEEDEFSHGDFAPWNLKKDGNTYVVYDWEHCGRRMKGFDLLHYVVMPKVLLGNIPFIHAIKEGIEEIQCYVPEFNVDIEQFIIECRKLRLERKKYE